MEISQLYIYPIKSLREVAVPEAVLTSTGFEYDRRFMLLKVNQGDDGVEILQNMHVPHFPEMSLFKTDIVFPTEGKKNGKIIVTYRPPGAKDNGNPRITTLEVPLEPDVQGLEELTVTMHQSSTRGYHMGSKYNDWFSQCFGYKVVLVYLGPHWRRVLGSFPPGKSQAHREQATPLVSKRSATVLALLSLLLNIGVPLGQREISSFTLLVLVTITVAVLVTIGANRYGSGCGKRKEERITFADTAPYLMISETSVDNVSARLAGDKAMDLRKTRPNIVISGARTAFEEDFWAELMSLNVDYMTGKMGTGDSGNILKKLMKDRRVDKGARFSPVFGSIYNRVITMSEFPPSNLQPIVREVFELLRAKKETISVAETAAGGLISASLLSVSGASAVYKGGLTVYTLESRIAFAGWTPAHLENYNGPTPAIVAQMADHVRHTLGSTYTVSESGTAGPTGGTARNRTPGYVAVAVSTAHGTYTREVETGSDDRQKNMVTFAEESLKLLRDVLVGKANL
ncbi:MOSC domain protein [Aspergillus arachidicola]|uniref:MOSC domain protein n=1 Tax=Aspergillus arachidicola TaxID=656916 RepID=A0A2G7FQP6_9EURO|nr:MOSC domain protein [Aspergillus arachidicola]